MATSSIYSNINIKNRHVSHALVKALENSRKFEGKKIVIAKKCQEIKGDKIKEIFGDR